MKDLPLYWMQTHNFGDVLNPILYKFITGSDPVFSAASPKILAIGSVMSIAFPGDIVWGSGVLDPVIPLPCDQSTRFRMVRGPLTARTLTEKGIALPDDLLYGCPSQLFPMYVNPSPDRNEVIGFLPHYIDYGQVRKPLPPNVKLLSPATEPLKLIYEITSCKFVVSSSLHGLVVAEAYGIPAVWAELADNIGGGQFKFRDYYAATGAEGKPLDWRGGYDWHEAGLAADEWRPPVIPRAAILACCPFGE